MNRTIGVEQNLTPVKDYLSQKGFMVEEIDINKEYTKNIDKYDCLVVTGLNKDFLGVQDVVSRIPVIDAKGLTAEQVYNQVNSSLKQ